MATNTPEWKNSHKEDLRKYRRDWYARNKNHAKTKVQERLKENKRWFQEYKSTLKCECGASHPACLTFHHINPSDKDKDLCKAICDGWSRKRVMKEIEKCKVLCFNCHSILHWSERQT